MGQPGGSLSLYADASLRRAVPDDTEAMPALWRRAWASANPQVPSGDVAPPAHWRARAHSECFGAAECWLADGDGGLRGFLVIEPARRYLAQLHVEPAWHGRGIGRRLLAQACERMPDGWTLHMAEDNRRAHRFYAAAGLQAGARDLHSATGRPRIAWHWLPA